MVRQPSPAQPSHGEGAKEWKSFPTRAGGVSKLGNANTGRLLCHPVCPEHAGELPVGAVRDTKESAQVDEEAEVVWLPDNGREFRSRTGNTCSPKHR